MATVRRALVTLGAITATLLGTAVSAYAAQPTITGVSFSGTAGPGVVSPTITVTGSGFGARPTGTSDHITSCGAYPKNGWVFGTQFYFQDENNFEAGYSDSNGGNCVGIVIHRWNDRHIVFSFGTSYGTFAHWYLSNGDGYAVSIESRLWGGTVAGLS